MADSPECSLTGPSRGVRLTGALGLRRLRAASPGSLLMPMLSSLPALFLAGLVAGPAHAVGVNSDFPPWLRGDVVVHYDLDSTTGRLFEDESAVGQVRHQSHVMTYEAVFTAWHGLAVTVAMPHWVGESVRFSDARAMAFDPAANSGTMVDTGSLGNPDPVTGSGVGGAWLGLRGTPMHQDIFASRGDRVSWVMDVAYRFRDQTPFWTYGPRDKRGGGPGAGAFRFRTLVSTTHNRSSPYLVADLTRSFRLETDIVDDSGQTVATGMTIQPASSVAMTLGTEINAVEYGQGARLDIDLRSRFGYRSWQDLPSGTFLPSVLDSSQGVTATMSETSYLTLGGGVHWRFIDYLQLDILGDVGVNTGGRVEHHYPVDVELGALEWQVQSALRFRIRDLLIEQIQDAAARPNGAPPPPLAPASPPPPPATGS